MEEPSIEYPVGAVIEDQNAIMKIERFQKDRHGHHLYYCDVIKWKVEPPKGMKTYYPENKIWIWVRPESVANIMMFESYNP